MEGNSVLISVEEEKVDRKFVWKHIIKLAWPCFLEQIFANIIASVSTILVSSIGKEAVNAVSINTQPMFIPFVFFQAFNVGGTAIIARYLGMCDQKGAKDTCAQTLFLSLIMGLISAVGLYLGVGPLIRFLGATDDYYYLALDYMKYASIGLFFQAISTSVAAMLRGAGKTSISMIFSLASSLTNVVVAYVMIHVVKVGVAGAGIAFLVGHIIGSMIALYMLFFVKSLPIHITPKDLVTIRPKLIKRISQVGMGSALETLSLRIGLIVFTMLIVDLGTAEYAAHNMAGTVYNYIISIGMALSVALISLVGQNLGAGRPNLAEKYMKESINIGLVCSAVAMALLLIFPGFLADVLTKEADVKKNLVMCFRMLALFVPGQVIQMGIAGGLRGGGDTKWPLISTMTGVLGVRMVLGYLFISVFHMGLFGAWLANCLDQDLRGIIIYFRYRSGKWKYKKI